MSTDDIMHRTRAAGELVRNTPGARTAATLATAAGVALFGDGIPSSWVICRHCGCIGEPGDDCGRRPAAHTLEAHHR